MTFTYQRTYRGPVKLVILDWAGTTMDYGCYAPAVVFVEVYKRKGVEISMEEARLPMGAHKLVRFPQHALFFGGVHLARRRGDGTLDGAGDPRRGGTCRVV